MATPSASAQANSGGQPVDLWQNALAMLDEDLRARLDVNRSTQRNILEKTLKIAEEKKQLCIQKRWKFTRDGKDIVVRDMLEKIIKWVDYFKAVGDAASQFDTLHSSLPWAAVRFLLGVAVSDTHLFGSTLLGLETVSHLITRYRIFEDVYMRRSTAANAELEPLLTGLYAEILIFLAKAKRYFQTPTGVRMMKSALVTFQNSVDEQLEKVVAQEAKVSAIALLSDSETLNRLRDLEQPVLRIAEQANLYAKFLEATRYRAVLDWLSPIPFMEHQKMHSEFRLAGSGEWLLNHGEYQEWQSSSVSSMFLLHGMAGSGKSSLTSAVVEFMISQSLRQASPAPLAYFYCSKNASETERSVPKEIMRSVLRQLAVTQTATRTLHSAVVNEYERRDAEAKAEGFDIPRLALHECVNIVLDITGSDPATIIIDAIDELQPANRYELFRALQQVLRDSASIVKIFITSRDDDQIFALFSDTSKLRITAELNRNDVEIFARSELSRAIDGRRLLAGEVSSALHTELLQTLIDGAGEIFQLVIWQLEKLCNMRHEVDVRNAMRRFSGDTLDRLYSEILSDIRTAAPYSNRTAIRTFSLLLCLHELLSPVSLLEALMRLEGNGSVALQLPELLRMCSNLIILDSSMDVLRFAHTSVQEFLETQPEFVANTTNEVAAISCLNSCLYAPPIELRDGLSPTKHFYHYGTLYWAEHCRAAFAPNAGHILSQSVKDFVLDDDGNASLSLIQWLESIGEYSKALPRHHFLQRKLVALGSRDHTPVFIACVFGLTTLLNHLSLVVGFDSNQKNDTGQTGLYLACASGQYEIASILLEHGANVDPEGGRYGRPLQAACFEGYTEIVRLLLETGADPKLRGKFDSALLSSMEGGHEDIAALILHDRFEITSQGEFNTIFEAACRLGHLRIVQQLQKVYGLSFGNVSSAGSKAVQAAISKGHFGVLERLVQTLRDPKAELPADSVAIAAVGGQNGIITLLLDQGLEIDHKGQFGTPIRSACLFGHESTVSLLLQRGAEAAGISSVGNSLEAAAMNGHVSIAKLLLQARVDVNIRGGQYCTPLQTAAYRGHLKVAEILVDAGAEVLSTGFTKDAFHAAAEGGHEDIIRLFLDRGFGFRDPLERPRYGSLGPPIYKDLLRESSPTRSTHIEKHRYKPPKPEIWKDLSISSDSSDSFCYRDNYALEIAASKGHHQVVKIILDNSGTIGVPPSVKEMGSAFCEAATEGHEIVVQLFISQGIDIWPYLKKALRGASLHGHLGVVNILSEQLRLSTSTSTSSSNFLPSVASRDGRDTEIGDFSTLNQDPVRDCTIIEEEILLPGCQGDHVPIVKRAFSLMGTRSSEADLKRLRTQALCETAWHGGDEVIKFLLHTVPFDNATLLEAIDQSCRAGHVVALLRLLENYRQKKHRRHRCSRMCFATMTCTLTGKYDGDDALFEVLNLDLRIAALKGYNAVVAILIQEGSEMNLTYEGVHDHFDNDQPFIWSLSEDEQSAFWQTALQGALKGWPEGDMSARDATVRVLLENGANVIGLPEKPASLLATAVQYCSPGTVQLMFDKCAFFTCFSERLSAFQGVVQREFDSVDILEVLLKADNNPKGINFQQNLHDASMKATLNSALSFFSTVRSGSYIHDGKFLESKSVRDALRRGPGALVRKLLQLLSTERAEDGRYSLLLQMSVVANDRDFVDLLIQRGVDVNAQGYYYGTALQCAARFGDLDLVQLLLSSGAEVNILKGQHGTALRAAVLGGHEQVVCVLLEHGADINLRPPKHGFCDDNDAYILRLALKSPNVAILRSLLAAGADLDGDVEQQPSLLITACDLGNLDIVRLLLESKVDVNPPRERSRKEYSYPNEPHHCISDSRIDLNHPTTLDYWYRDERASALHMACAEGRDDIAQVLLEFGADVDLEVVVTDAKGYTSKTPLQMAAYAGSLPLVQLLVSAGANIDYCNPHGTALCVTSKKNKLDVVEELLNLGAAVDGPLGRWNAVREACQSQSQIVEALLERFPQDVEIDGDDSEGGHALQVASFHLLPEIVELLLDHGANASSQTSKYGSPLQAALEGLTVPFLGRQPEFSPFEPEYNTPFEPEYNKTSGNRTHYPQLKRRPDTKKVAACERIVRVLLTYGANANPTLRTFGSPLHVASYIGNALIAEMLLSKSADPNSVCKRFGTVLFAAMEGGNPEIVQLLLNKGSNVNSVSISHGTALHYACYRQDVSMVRMLLSHGADANAVCDLHGSPLSAALSNKLHEDFWKYHFKEIGELLLQSGSYTRLEKKDLFAAVNKIRSSRENEGMSEGERLVRIFLEHDPSLRVTSGALVAAIKRLGAAGVDTLQKLLQRYDDSGVNEELVAAARESHIMKIAPEVFSKVFKNCAQDYPYRTYGSNSEAREVLGILLEHDRDIPIREGVVVDILGTGEQFCSL